MIDAVDELMERAKDDEGARKFWKFHRGNPQVLRFLIEEIESRLAKGHTRFSFNSLWQYCRGELALDLARPGKPFVMNDHLQPFYSRAIIIFRPDFNEKTEFRKSHADEVFGVELVLPPETGKRARRCVRRLRWADGTPLERGWRPTLPVLIDDDDDER